MDRRHFLGLAFTSLGACSRAPSLRFAEGKAMGTTWSLKMPETVPLSAGQWTSITEGVARSLSAWEGIFSLWRGDSAISAWNRSVSTDWQTVPAELAEVAALALELAAKTGGAFNPTLADRLRSDDFLPHLPGEANAPEPPPAGRWSLIEVRLDPPALRKGHPALELDVNALVEGYALDHLARQLEAASCHDFLLFLGGEMAARGTWLGQPWPVVIESPLGGPPSARLGLLDEAVSTSGTYRQHHGSGKAWTTHLRDGRTGGPVSGEVLAVSVCHRRAILADGWATALLALGARDGLAMARREDLAAQFTLRGPGGEVSVVRTKPCFL